MHLANWIGSLGVALLLLAFLLNLAGRLDVQTARYQGLNAVGAGLACYSAFLIEFTPFVVLEGTWAAVAVAALLRGARGAAR